MKMGFKSHAWIVEVFIILGVCRCTAHPQKRDLEGKRYHGCGELEYFDRERSECIACNTCPAGSVNNIDQRCGYGIGQHSVCEPCTPGTYSFGGNEIACKPCIDCQTGYSRAEVTSCNLRADATCGDCLEGFLDHYGGQGGITKCYPVPTGSSQFLLDSGEASVENYGKGDGNARILVVMVLLGVGLAVTILVVIILLVRWRKRFTLCLERPHEEYIPVPDDEARRLQPVELCEDEPENEPGTWPEVGLDSLPPDNPSPTSSSTSSDLRGSTGRGTFGRGGRNEAHGYRSMDDNSNFPHSANNPQSTATVDALTLADVLHNPNMIPGNEIKTTKSLGSAHQLQSNEPRNNVRLLGTPDNHLSDREDKGAAGDETDIKAPQFTPLIHPKTADRSRANGGVRPKERPPQLPMRGNDAQEAPPLDPDGCRDDDGRAPRDHDQVRINTGPQTDKRPINITIENKIEIKNGVNAADRRTPSAQAPPPSPGCVTPTEEEGVLPYPTQAEERVV